MWVLICEGLAVETFYIEKTNHAARLNIRGADIVCAIKI
jgi:hypothetical protein